MSGDPPGGAGDRPYTLHLTAEGLGAALGTTAWVLGALEIMRDRGHAEEDERYHELLERLAPPIERLLGTIGGARALDPDPAHLAAVDGVYGEIRAAFEAWIELTATDTAHAAIGRRLRAAAEAGEFEVPADFPLTPGEPPPPDPA